jgi:hypothetical protein
MRFASKTPLICTSSFVLSEALVELAGFFEDKLIVRGHLSRKQEGLNFGMATISGDLMLGEDARLLMGHFLITTGSALRSLSTMVWLHAYWIGLAIRL